MATESGSENDFVDISGDGGLLKKILSEGDGELPRAGDEVEAHYTGTLDDGTVFDSSRSRNKTFKFVIGKGQVIKGWDRGFATMRKGEKAVLRCRSDYAYGKQGQGKIPPDATLNFDVELLSFGPKKKERWEYSDEEKQVEANELKERGNVSFQAKQFAEALALYSEALELVESTPSLEAVTLALRLNCAQACLSLGDYPGASAQASEALRKDPLNVKALYRRAVARNHLGLAEEALEDLTRALERDGENKAVKGEMAKSRKIIADARKKSKAAFGGLFSKIDMYDDKEMPVVPGSDPLNPKAYLDIAIGGRYVGRVVLLLYRDTTPRTCDNFLSLCIGDRTSSLPPHHPLHYLNSTFHRVIPSFMIQGGDFTKGDGTGGESIFGERFADENFKVKHRGEGLLSMANAGPDSNGSQFFITLKDTPHLDGKHVVFGRVVQGMEVVREVEANPTGEGDRPLKEVKVVGCGRYDEREPPKPYEE